MVTYDSNFVISIHLIRNKSLVCLNYVLYFALTFRPSHQRLYIVLIVNVILSNLKILFIILIIVRLRLVVKLLAPTKIRF